MKLGRKTWMFGIAALLTAPLLAVAQEAGEQEEDEGRRELPKLGEPAGGNEMEELQRLFLEVERNLKRIDDLLNDASSGDVPLSEVADSGLDDLLRQTGQESQAVLQGIDEILEIARQRGQSQNQSQSQQGGQGQKPQQGNSPLDQPRDGSRRQDEATPEGAQPHENEQPGSDGEKPDSPEEQDNPGQNRAGSEQSHDQGDPRAIGADGEEWGMLPDKVQEIFRNEGTEDLPVQYRDWIDAYYRRLNEVDR